MKSYIAKHYKLLCIAGAIISLAIAAIYLKFTPAESSSVDGLQKIILLYGHSVCWVLLCGASVLWAIQGKNKWSKILAYTALVVYVIFIATLLVTKYS